MIMTKTNIRLARDVTAPEWPQSLPCDGMLERIGLYYNVSFYFGKVN